MWQGELIRLQNVIPPAATYLIHIFTSVCVQKGGFRSANHKLPYSPCPSRKNKKISSHMKVRYAIYGSCSCGAPFFYIDPPPPYILHFYEYLLFPTRLSSSFSTFLAPFSYSTLNGGKRLELAWPPLFYELLSPPHWVPASVMSAGSGSSTRGTTPRTRTPSRRSKGWPSLSAWPVPT
jgi:hypothetical protein